MSKSCCNMREFLVFSPVNISIETFIVVIMGRCRLVLKSLLPSNLDIQKLPGGLSPSMVVLKEHVVQVVVTRKASSSLIEVRWDVADLVDDTRSNLCNVHIDKEGIVSVDLEELVLG